MKLFIGNVPFKRDAAELKEYLQAAGLTVGSVNIPLDRDTQQSRGFAFAEIAEGLDNAQMALVQAGPFVGRTLTVKVAEQRQQRPTSRGHGYDRG